MGTDQPKIGDQVRDVARTIGESSPVMTGSRALADLGRRLETIGVDVQAWMRKTLATKPRRGDIYLPRERPRSVSKPRR